MNCPECKCPAPPMSIRRYGACKSCYENKAVTVNEAK